MDLFDFLKHFEHIILVDNKIKSTNFKDLTYEEIRDIVKEVTTHETYKKEIDKNKIIRLSDKTEHLSLCKYAYCFDLSENEKIIIFNSLTIDSLQSFFILLVTIRKTLLNTKKVLTK